jgi:hypothetical protein
MRAQVIAVDLKPLRLNFAQVCVQCGEKSCESPACVAKHERSRWIVCRQCDGYMETPTGEHCYCLAGVEETFPSGTTRLPRRLAVVSESTVEAPAVAKRARVAPCVPGAPGSLAYDPEFAEYLAYKRQRS